MLQRCGVCCRSCVCLRVCVFTVQPPAPQLPNPHKPFKIKLKKPNAPLDGLVVIPIRHLGEALDGGALDVEELLAAGQRQRLLLDCKAVDARLGVEAARQRGAVERRRRGLEARGAELVEHGAHGAHEVCT